MKEDYQQALTQNENFLQQVTMLEAKVIEEVIKQHFLELNNIYNLICKKYF